MPTTQEVINTASGLLNTAGNYLNTEDAIDSARAAGQQAVEGGNLISAEALAGTEFKPYTVTSNLATSTAGPSGGVTQTLSEDELRRQNAYLGSAETLFGGVGGDTNAQTQALYDQLRAIQAPAEMRRQQATQEQMFGRGTGGMTSGIYGGSGMQFADAQARQEQQGRDMLMARQMVGKEQDRRLLQAQGLMDAGYNTSNQASDMFTTGYNPATLAAQGDIRGQELSAEAKSQALTQMINAEVIAGNLSRKQAQDLLTTVTGSADASGNYTGGLLGGALNWVLGEADDALSGITTNSDGSITGIGGFVYAGGDIPTDANDIDLSYITGTGSGNIPTDASGIDLSGVTGTGSSGSYTADGTYIADFY